MPFAQDNRFKDFMIYCDKSLVNIRSAPKIADNIVFQVEPKKIIGISTGKVFKEEPSGQIWLEVSTTKSNVPAWVMKIFVVAKSNTVNVADETQKKLDEWIMLEQKLFFKMQITYMVCMRLKAKGKNVNTEFKELLRIWGNWKGRQNSIKQEGATFLVKKFADYGDKINKINLGILNKPVDETHSLSGLGVIPFIVIGIVAIVAAVITAGTIAYIQRNYDKGLQEYQACPELKDIFKKYNIPETEQKEVLDAINKQYKDVQIDTKKKDFWKQIAGYSKYILIGGVVLFVATKFSGGKPVIIQKT
jgi:hypothetical protein